MKNPAVAPTIIADEGRRPPQRYRSAKARGAKPAPLAMIGPSRLHCNSSLMSWAD